MSYGRLNIWARYSNCELITDCWRQDLVIKTCGGKYLIDIDPAVIGRLKAKYPGYTVAVNRDYHDADRIMFGYKSPAEGKFVYHVEVDVPPGCYVIWTRVCHGGNEETNKVMAIVHCGEEVCVNLLLDSVETCGGGFLHPFMVNAFKLRLPEKDILLAARAIMAVAQKPEQKVVKELGQRMEEARLMQDKKLLEVVGKIQKMFGARRMK
jgi:hypothetical protein